MKYRLKFLLFVLIIGVISTWLHELGHCVFYWIQGIPASMSLVMEYPLIDITAQQYGIGSAGGPLFSILLFTGAYFFVRKYEKKSKAWNISSAIIIANSFYLIFRSLLGLVKKNGGEIECIMNLFGLNFEIAAVFFLILAFAILILWIRRFQIKSSLGNASYYFILFVAYLAVIIVMEIIDTKYFWDKYPTIQIEDVGVHNPHD